MDTWVYGWYPQHPLRPRTADKSTTWTRQLDSDDGDGHTWQSHSQHTDWAQPLLLLLQKDTLGNTSLVAGGTGETGFPLCGNDYLADIANADGYSGAVSNQYCHMDSHTYCCTHPLYYPYLHWPSNQPHLLLMAAWD